jgi:hypothetical protein
LEGQVISLKPKQREVMPTKAEIEAELQASEVDKAVMKLREMQADWQECEASLRAAEREVWQPHWSHNDPLRERLRRVGKTEEEIAEFERRLRALETIILRKSLPPDIQKELDDANTAEKSAAAQLKAIVSGKRT